MQEQEYIQESPFHAPKIPLDHEGYTVSFDIQSFDPSKMAQFYNIFGFVVFDNILKEGQIEKTIDDLWADISEKMEGRVDRNNPETWHFIGFLNRYGFVNDRPISKPQIWLNRQNPNVYKCFKTIYQAEAGKPLDEPLFAMFDRASMIRPSKLNQSWKTRDIYHFDIQPWWWTGVVESSKRDWRYQDDYDPDQFSLWLGEGNYVPKVGPFSKLAGVLALSDTNQTSGGFECVPGFQSYIKTWCSQHDFGSPIGCSPVLMRNFQKIFQRKGSLLVFSRDLPHNIYANESQNFRYAQYLRMSPQSCFMLTMEEKEKRKECLKYMIPQYVDVKGSIAKEIYMLEDDKTNLSWKNRCDLI